MIPLNNLSSRTKYEKNDFLNLTSPLRDGPKRSFVREELMLIPEETQLPPDYVQGWS